ncbi:MAG TPA: flavodoxin domain-containing protein [Terracidiphilus sp.]|jgi:menaquinone-dependent protoporphyrinogen oxidase|nr:flavodoxin domain-containing protein [Terracidiphilus sp.]
MEPTVLVAYATRSGSTAELAQTVAEILHEQGMKAEVLPAREIHSTPQASAVVLVAALYMGQLHRDARRFLRCYRTRLTEVPVALFVPGPVQNQEKDWTGARQQLDRQLAKFPWFSPVATKIVGGVWNPARLGFPFKWIPVLRNMKAMDARDWDAIRAAVRDVAACLQAALHAHA